MGTLLFLDGTKIEANANCYTFVWKKTIDKHPPSYKPKSKPCSKRSKKKSEMKTWLHDEQGLPELGEDNAVTADKLEKAVKR
jgi:hypothetical protein